MIQAAFETCLSDNLYVYILCSSLVNHSARITGGGAHADIALIIVKGVNEGNMHLKAASSTARL